MIVFTTGCNSQSKNDIPVANLSDKNRINSFKLPNKLSEISGLTTTNDHRIFANNDEKSIIYQLDYNSGKIIKSFTVGKKTLKEDFEGIAFTNGLFYLVTSNGDLYEFTEGNDKDEVKYKKFKTFLDSDNDVEGLCFDPNTNSLLLVCKGNPGKKYKGNRAVYEFSLDKKKLEKKPRFLLPLTKIMENVKSDFNSKLGEFFLIKDDTFAPSGIEYNSKSGTYFILSFKGRMIVEISKTGDIIKMYFLDSKNHRQPEGITFSTDNKLIISDESAGKKAMLTVYNLP
jgi:uncharacterized protein YjiK